MEITRSYTVALPSLQVDPCERECDGKRFYLMIKIYPAGTVTPSLQSLVSGDLVTISDHTGNLEESRLLEAREIVLIAAGTGFTPMVRLIRRVIVDDSKSTVSVKLLFANREEKDILWKKQLDELVETSNNRFQTFYTISNPSAEWEGYEGRINIEMLLEILPPPPAAGSEQELLICVCGPDPFTHGIVSMLRDLSYTSKMIHAFLG